MKHEEDNLQIAAVRWFRYQYPDVVIFAIPNGGQRNAVTGAIMKATGTLAGVADLFVMCAGNMPDNSTDIYLGAFIELKVGKNRQTDAQRELARKAMEAGYFYQVCRSFDEFKEVIENYLT